MRDVGFFSGERATRQRQQHTPGDFFPFRYMVEQHHKSLVANLFKVDAHLAVITQQPPALHACELDVSLPTTFSQLNCDGVYAFMECHRILAPLRPGRLLSEFLESLEPAATFGSYMLIEDVHLGLCGVVLQVWELAYAHKPDGNRGQAHRLYNTLVSRLRFWRGHLQALRAGIVTDNMLRSAYNAKEEDQNTVMPTLLNETEAFYHLLALLVSTHAPLQDQISGPQLLSKAASLPPKAMRSVFHAVCIGALHQVAREEQHCRPPILQLARTIAREYIVTILENSCWCSNSSNTLASSHLNLALMDAGVEREDDVCHMPLGKFWLHVDGKPLCACGESDFLAKTGLADVDEIEDNTEREDR
jgi:hypothetical protein